MSPRIETMRYQISKEYDGISWKVRCQNMAPDQVTAIYYKFLNEGRFDKKKKPKKSGNREEFHQIDIFEYLNSLN